MVQSFNIDIKHASSIKFKENDIIIIVDAAKGNLNVTDLIGWEIAVIDHHYNVSRDEGLIYFDVREEYGSCSTIIGSYYEELEVVPTKEVATALLIGISSDTNQLKRKVNVKDISIYSSFFGLIDHEAFNLILRNNIEIADIPYFQKILDETIFDGKLGFCYFESGCPPSMLGILGDFLLTMNEIHFVALFAKNGNVINLSFRSEERLNSALDIAKKVLSKLGKGGGHNEMAGGLIEDHNQFDVEKTFKQLKRWIK